MSDKSTFLTIVSWAICLFAFPTQHATSQSTATSTRQKQVDQSIAAPVLQGQVTDKTTGEPVEMATVYLSRSESGKTAGYAFTDENGRFSIQVKDPKEADSLHISVSILGHKTHKQAVTSYKPLNIVLEQETFALREVQIRPGRVWGQQDTINYNIAQFLSEKDETIKDVIKKLPGVNVDETGKISYNGKNISDLYVEGMDLSDGKYNKITDNLNAQSVETVQLMQNHQPVRLLQKELSTEDIAMNIKLKPEFRAKWMFTAQAGAGSSPFLWNASANAMQLSRESQSTYTYKSNNTGDDLVDEQQMMIARSPGRIREPEAQSFLNQPSIMAPLKKERLLFNDVHSMSGNRLYKLNETTQLRINADYTHDIRKQERGSETTYFYPDDTVHVTEQSKTRIRSDEAEVKLHLENNAADKFLTNDLLAFINRQKSDAGISGNRLKSDKEDEDTPTLLQQIETPEIKLRNNLRCLWSRSAYTYEAQSLLRYNHRPSELIADDFKQTLNINTFYTDNYFSILNKKGVFTQQYATGFHIEGSNIQNRYGLYVSPLWQINDGKWQLNLSTPLMFTFFAPANTSQTGIYPAYLPALMTSTDSNLQKSTSRLTANPSFSAWYKLNYAWRFSFSARYNEQYGNIRDLYASPYYTDYRHITQNSGVLPIQQTQNYTAYGEYKNTINEFFATLSVNYSRNRANLIREQVFDDDDIISSSRELVNTSKSCLLRGTISKGFYDIKTKASLDYLFSNTHARQLNNGEIVPYRMSYMQYEPKLSQTISRYIDVTYEANFRYGGSKIGNSTKLTPLWNIVQKLQLTCLFSDFEIGLSADHYHNDINDNQTINACFADFSFKWKHANWQFTASSNNLFDKQQYRYTQYSAVQSYTSWINIRGREFLLAAQYRF